MYLQFSRYPQLIGRFLAVFSMLVFGAVKEGYGQEPMVRAYADRSDEGGGFLSVWSITNSEFAVDGDISTHATLTVTLGEGWQQMHFPTNLPAGTTIRVKIGTAGNILSLLSGLQIRAYQNLNSSGGAVSIGGLISLLAGEDQAEIVFTPTQSFNSVRISSSGIALGGGLKIYEAYYLTNPDGVIPCDVPADILHGSTGDIAGGLNAVDNPYAAIDGNSVTFATMRANVSATGNRTHLTALYNTVSQPNDSIRIVLRRPEGVLEANLLSENFRISTSWDNTNNGELLLDPELLSLRLLSPGSEIQVLTYPVSVPYNRVAVSLGGGLLQALSSLEVYEIERIMAKPAIAATNLVDNEVVICEGETVTLLVENPLSGNEYRWYSEPTGSTPILVGYSLDVTPTELGSLTYYLARFRAGCTEESEREVVTITVLPQPGKPHLTITDVQN